jgi:hypothetical protein
VHVYKTALLLVEEDIGFNQEFFFSFSFPLLLTNVLSSLSAIVWWNRRQHDLGLSLAHVLSQPTHSVPSLYLF